MLRRTTQHGSRTNATARSNDRRAFQHRMGRNEGPLTDSNLFTNDGKRAYIDPISQFCRGMHDGS
jgi:hypothetical protein